LNKVENKVVLVNVLWFSAIEKKGRKGVSITPLHPMRRVYVLDRTVELLRSSDVR
jgi:hypothetical protein